MNFFNKLRELMTGSNIVFKKLIENGAIIIDVRSQEEFESGNAKGSKNISIENIELNIEQLRNKKVIVVSTSGARGKSAKAKLEKYGIVVYNGGAWQNIDKL